MPENNTCKAEEIEEMIEIIKQIAILPNSNWVSIFELIERARAFLAKLEE